MADRPPPKPPLKRPRWLWRSQAFRGFVYQVADALHPAPGMCLSKGGFAFLAAPSSAWLWSTCKVEITGANLVQRRSRQQ